MKIKNKILILFMLVLIMFSSVSFGIVAKDFFAVVVSRGVAIVLSILQYARFILPAIYFVIQMLISTKKNKSENSSKKNILKSIIIHLIISVIMFVVITEIGELILKNAQVYGYSSQTIDYVYYNGKTIYYHR